MYVIKRGREGLRAGCRRCDVLFVRRSQRNFPTPTRRGREGCPTKKQVGAPGEQSFGDYNRNRKQSRLGDQVRAETVG